MANICVYCGSCNGIDEIYLEQAQALGILLAQNNCRLIFGGGSTGLMGALADSALQAGTEVIGVIPDAVFKEEEIHIELTELHVTPSMHKRKALMADLADAFIVLPGGLGTLEECFETWAWNAIGIHSKPIGLLNCKGYFDSLFSFIDRMVSDGFLSQELRTQILLQSQADILLKTLLSKLTQNA